MSDFMESLFQGIDILIDKRLENVSYDSTIVCTIVDASKSKDGKYRVTDGSVTYLAYSDQSKYRNGEQVRVNVPMGDFSQKKFIVGKYVSDNDASPITYVSPADNTLNISGNLANGVKGSILANGEVTEKVLWQKMLDDSAVVMQDNGLYDTIILKADFKTLLANYNPIVGNYGLRLDFLVTPTVESDVRMKRTLTLDSSELFGNPYSFALPSPQAKTLKIDTMGIILGIELVLYQKDNFKDINDNRITYATLSSGKKQSDNIIVSNIAIGMGCDLTLLEDNKLQIYTKNDPSYIYGLHTDETNLKTIGLLWINKDDNNEYIGFSDGIYDYDYDELEYIKTSKVDNRLIGQKGKIGVPQDKTSLNLSANIEEASSSIKNAIKVIDTDLVKVIREFQSFLDCENFDSNFNRLLSAKTGSEQDKYYLAQIATNITNELNELQKYYKEVLEYGYNLSKYLESNNKTKLEDGEETGLTKPSILTGEKNHWDNILNSFKMVEEAVNWLLATDSSGGCAEITEDGDYSILLSIYDTYKIRIDRIMAMMWGYLGALQSDENDKCEHIFKTSGKCIFYVEEKESCKYDDYFYLNKYFPKSFFNDKTKIDKYINRIALSSFSAYKPADLSSYGNKYCIYWYRYEKNYVAPSEEKILSDGWRRLTPKDDFFIETDLTSSKYKANTYYVYNNGRFSLSKGSYESGVKYYTKNPKCFAQDDDAVNIGLSGKYVDKKGTVIKNQEGKPIHAPTPSTSKGFFNRYMQNDLQEERYKAVLFYNHNMYTSNELIFRNSEPVPDKTTLDKGDILIFEHKENSSDSYQFYSITGALSASSEGNKLRQIRCKYDGLQAKDNALVNGQLYWYVPMNSTMITVDEDDLVNNKKFAIDKKRSEYSYTIIELTANTYIPSKYYYKTKTDIYKLDKNDTIKSGRTYYTREATTLCFYKKVTAKQKEDLTDVIYEWDKWIFEDETTKIDSRDFWYKIKPYYQKCQKDLITCEFVKNKDVDSVWGEQTFNFGISGTSGTKYTLSLKESSNQIAAHGNNDFPLVAKLYDANNNLLPISTIGDLSIAWECCGTTDASSGDINSFGKVLLEKECNITIPKGYYGIIKVSGKIVLKGSTLDSEDEPTTVGKLREVDLQALYSIPYSGYNAKGEDGEILVRHPNKFYIDGPTTIIYNSFGSLDNSSMYGNTPYKIYANEDISSLHSISYSRGQEITDEKLEWTIEHFLVDEDKKLTKLEDADAETQKFYSAYMPKLQNNNLIPAPMYLSDLKCYAVVCAKCNNKYIWRQPIIICQNRYGSAMLNDWDGSYVVDEEVGTILGTMFGAGRKTQNNTFEGVLMGNVSLAAGGIAFESGGNLGFARQSGLGIYGFQNGEQSFCFNIDGSAFLGKAGNGRIIFNGDNGTIASGNWYTGQDNANHKDYSLTNPYPNGGIIGQDGKVSRSSNAGMCIDLDSGHIDAFDFKLTSKNIYLNSNPKESTDYYFMIGSDGEHTFPGQIHQGRTKGYLALDKGGNLEIKVNSLYLTEQLGGANLLNQTQPTLTTAQYLLEDGEPKMDADGNHLYRRNGSGNIVYYWDVSNKGNPITTKWTTNSANAEISGTDTIYASNEDKKASYTCILIQRETGTDTALLSQSVSKLKKGKTYTVSGYARRALSSADGETEVQFKVGVSNSSPIPLIDLVDDEGVINNNKKIFKISNKQWTYFEYTVKLDSDANNATISFESGVNFYLYHAKFELGSVATDWELSRWDVQNGAKLEKDNYNKYLAQDQIFKKLITNPNNGEQMVGIWMVDGSQSASGKKELYINATYMATGILRSSNWNGTIRAVECPKRNAQGEIIKVGGETQYLKDAYGKPVYTYEIVNQPTKGVYMNLDEGKIWAATFELNAGTKGTSDYLGLFSDDWPDESDGMQIGDSNTDVRSWRIIAGDKFGVTKTGKLFATDAYISGKITSSSGEIGGWKIGSNLLYNDTYNSNKTKRYRTFMQSISNWDDAPNRSAFGAYLQTLKEGKDPDKDWNNDDNYTTTYNFYVQHDGDAYLKGKIDATSGEIGGWTITGSSLHNGSTYLNSSGSITGAAISGGSISIEKDTYFFKMGHKTNHPEVSGLNIQGGGDGVAVIKDTGTFGISGCHSIGGNNGQISFTTTGVEVSDKFYLGDEDNIFVRGSVSGGFININKYVKYATGSCSGTIRVSSYCDIEISVDNGCITQIKEIQADGQVAQTLGTGVR